MLYALVEVYETLKQCEPGGYITKQLAHKYLVAPDWSRAGGAVPTARQRRGGSEKNRGLGNRGRGGCGCRTLATRRATRCTPRRRTDGWAT